MLEREPQKAVERAPQTQLPSQDGTEMPSRLTPRFLFLISLATWQIACLCAFMSEADRLRTRLLNDATPGRWFDAPALDGTFLLPLLLLAPFCWSYSFELGGKSKWAFISSRLFEGNPRVSCLRGSLISAALAALTLCTTWHASQLVVEQELPQRRVFDSLPLVQDELSYQLQAQTFLAGRWKWPGPERLPELFHQVHVLNNGTFASRYFPGTGIWFAPWMAIGEPVWGGRLAAMLIVVGIFWIGVELQGMFVGIAAAVLTAFAPAMELLGNLTLSHLPTLLGLNLFLYSFLRLMRRPQLLWATLAGSGLAFAMLCRPLTAAAMGLPFGVWLLGSWAGRACESLQEEHPERFSTPSWSSCVLALAIPLIVGLGVIGWQNRELTGRISLTPYQLYTRLYTPRHAFGLFQFKDIEAEPNAQRLVDYDNWAEQLDFSRASRNLIERLQGSCTWWMGLIPLMSAIVLSGLSLPWQSTRIQLLYISACCLHLAHIPYWLSGMLNHHYAFESGPIWILLFACLSQQWLTWAVRRGSLLFPVWWLCLVVLSVMLNHVDFGEHGASRLRTGWQTFLIPTRTYRKFESALLQNEIERPALILVQSSPHDLHAQFVRNMPPFDAEVLVGMHRPELYPVEKVVETFPERSVYLYRTDTAKLSRLSHGFIVRPEGESAP